MSKQRSPHTIKKTIEGVLQICLGKVGGVVWVDQIDASAFSHGENIYLPTPTGKHDDEFDLILALAMREVARLEYSDQSAFDSAVAGQNVLALAGSVEDARLKCKLETDYLGVRRLFRSAFSVASRIADAKLQAGLMGEGAVANYMVWKAANTALESFNDARALAGEFQPYLADHSPAKVAHACDIAASAKGLSTSAGSVSAAQDIAACLAKPPEAPETTDDQQPQGDAGEEQEQQQDSQDQSGEQSQPDDAPNDQQPQGDAGEVQEQQQDSQDQSGEQSQPDDAPNDQQPQGDAGDEQQQQESQDQSGEQSQPDDAPNDQQPQGDAGGEQQQDSQDQGSEQSQPDDAPNDQQPQGDAGDEQRQDRQEQGGEQSQPGDAPNDQQPQGDAGAEQQQDGQDQGGEKSQPGDAPNEQQPQGDAGGEQQQDGQDQGGEQSQPGDAPNEQQPQGDAGDGQQQDGQEQGGEQSQPGGNPDGQQPQGDAGQGSDWLSDALASIRGFDQASPPDLSKVATPSLPVAIDQGALDAIEAALNNLGTPSDLLDAVEAVGIADDDLLQKLMVDVSAGGGFATENVGDNRLGAVPARLTSVLLRHLHDQKRTPSRLASSGHQVDPTRLWRLKRFGDTAVFRKRDLNQGVDAGVSILLDRSGSMDVDIDEAVDITHAFVVALQRIAGVKTSLDLFPGYTSENERVVEFRQNPAKVKRLLHEVTASGGTPTGTALRSVLDSLLDLRCEKRVVFIITDGDPNPRDVHELQSQLQRAKDQGVVVIAVGVSDAADVAAHFENNVKVDFVADLPRALEAIFKSKIANGILA